MKRETLIWFAKKGGNKLYGDNLEFYASPSVCILTLGARIYQELEGTDRSAEECSFAYREYVFFPISGREPLDVSGVVLLESPGVVDDNGCVYSYCHDDGTVYVMYADVMGSSKSYAELVKALANPSSKESAKHIVKK